MQKHEKVVFRGAKIPNFCSNTVSDLCSAVCLDISLQPPMATSVKAEFGSGIKPRARLPKVRTGCLVCKSVHLTGPGKMGLNCHF
jgi:hypothetical protein